MQWQDRTSEQVHANDSFKNEPITDFSREESRQAMQAVLAEVKKGLPAMRAIMLSNYATPQHMKASADAGAEYFLDKSADFERITEILTQMKDETEGR